MRKDCVFCQIELEPKQRMLLSNEHCMFLQLDDSDIKGKNLEGAGVIVPKKHRETAFDLTKDEWNATYDLLLDVQKYIDEKHQPDGYNLGWNCGKVGGQHIFHAHFHVLPRYQDEPLSGKGIRYMFKNEKNQRIHDGT
ncbi:HIT family protein [Oceanobacillus halophilus]|uniref:HIT domain-containing protein n=1 Tax=Oceanobacillus halophilus TaxID=930130 RepID=A0A495A2Y4_9BACI|nr:HIT domain-containing protein [Oceanobacillus halophilus]RKQ33937.1 HIT domain-containing protein [Oceanobacillus halophilus]